MKLSLTRSALPVVAVSVALLALLAPVLARADGPDASTPAPTSPAAQETPAPVLSCVSGAFADRVEQGRPMGDAATVFAAKRAVYFLDVANRGEPTAVTLVWTLDGREVQRQTLDVGRAAHWHTGGLRPLGGAGTVQVEVLDAAGRSLKTDAVLRDAR